MEKCWGKSSEKVQNKFRNIQNMCQNSSGRSWKKHRDGKTAPEQFRASSKKVPKQVPKSSEKAWTHVRKLSEQWSEACRIPVQQLSGTCSRTDPTSIQHLFGNCPKIVWQLTLHRDCKRKRETEKEGCVHASVRCMHHTSARVLPDQLYKELMSKYGRV